jgi:hypothetical protein
MKYIGGIIMVYRGYVSNGTIRLEDSVILPEGAEVSVELAGSAKEAEPVKQDLEPNAPTIEEKIAAIMIDVPQEEWDRLPADLTDNLDHYLYGTPK